MPALSIARDFSETPGPREPDEGEYSGQLFLTEFLLPRYQEATAKGEELLIDLDGAEGYATSFLEAAFGGLARLFEPTDILKTLRFKCEDEPYLSQEIEKYILDARKK